MWIETSKTSEPKNSYYHGPDYPISESQRRAIFAIARKVRMDDETRRDFIFMVTGKRSTKDLLFREANKVIKELKRQFPKLVKLKKKPKHKPIDILTESQNELILKLCHQLNIDPRSEYVRGIFYKSFGKFYPQTVSEGSDAIEALKAIIARNQTGTKQ